MGQPGSARLTVHWRLAIAKRVTEEGWSITEAAVTASGEPTDGLEMGSPVPHMGEAGAGSLHPTPPHPPTREGKHRAEDRTVASGPGRPELRLSLRPAGSATVQCPEIPHS